MKQKGDCRGKFQPAMPFRGVGLALAENLSQMLCLNVKVTCSFTNLW